MQVVSALDGCAQGYGKDAVLRPAFLKFQLGGVQDFIAQARSTRDLWSGSYLLSWLMAAGMKALAWEIGPDAVIFPNLKGQPLFDLHLRDSLWSQLTLNGKNGWDHVQPKSDPSDPSSPSDNAPLLTPNLPNVFLAVVPQDRAKDIARLVEEAIREEWHTIAANSWDFLDKAGMFPDEEARLSNADRKARFDHQIKHQLSIAWQATPWPENLDAALALADSFADGMPIRKARQRVQAIINYATQTMPAADRDGRYYVGGDSGPKTNLNNIGLGWSIILAANGWQLDATRALRTFDAWSTGTQQVGTFQNKDSLNGHTEAVAGGRIWLETASSKGGALASLFKHDDWLGATALVKRVWHLAHLKEKWDLPTDSNQMPIPDTRQIARGEPDGDGDSQPDLDSAPGENYFAILALDGDSIGQWVSGEKTPAIRHQLSDYTDAGGLVAQGALKYYQDHKGQDFLSANRPLSPSYHLQFSAALSNFALHFAGRIVRHFKGHLIYSGGDDVLAMLPANHALACAQALRAAFRGESPGVDGISCPAPGYLTLDSDKDQFRHPIPFILPGPAADCSVGIAIAHFKSPLQDAVRAAQAAEKRAKKLPGKAAVAVSLFKRSGEITEWGTKWDSGGINLYHALLSALQVGSLSTKFPHRVCQLLTPYLTATTGLGKGSVQPTADFPTADIITREFQHALDRQGKGADHAALLGSLRASLATLDPSHPSDQTDPAQLTLTALIGLSTTVAFTHRTTTAEKQPTP